MVVMQLICIEIVWQHLPSLYIKGKEEPEIRYEDWNFNSVNYLFTTDTK